LDRIKHVAKVLHSLWVSIVEGATNASCQAGFILVDGHHII